MDEIRIVSPGKPHGYPYPICKKLITSPYLKGDNSLPYWQ